MPRFTLSPMIQRARMMQLLFFALMFISTLLAFITASTSASGRNTGGPDGFGYTWVDSDEPDGPAYAWVDIQDTGTEVAFTYQLGDDDWIGPFPVGFGFPMYGSVKSEFWIQSNGAITFDGQYITSAHYEMPFGAYGAMIAWFWADLDPADGAGGLVYYQSMTLGNQQVLVIQYSNYDSFPHGDNAPNIDAEVILFADGHISIQYLSVDPGMETGFCTVGIQSDGADYGLTVLYNGSIADYPHDNLRIEFTPPAGGADISGRITNAANGVPIAGALISIGNSSATSDGSGDYAMTGVYIGEQPVHIEKQGFWDYDGTVTVNAGDNTFDFQLSAAAPWDLDTDFENGPGPFSAEGSVWQYGTPTFAPNNAHSGTHAWGTILDGFYGDNQQEWLIMTQSVEITDPDARLVYWHWYSYETNYDGYNVQISIDGGVFWDVLQPVSGYADPDGVSSNPGQGCWTNVGVGTFEVWDEVTYPLDPYLGETVTIAFRHFSDGSETLSGATIDDLRILANGGQAGPVTLTLTGAQTVIPANGGDLVYGVSFVSSLPQTIPNLMFWTRAVLPNGSSVGPLFNFPFTHTPNMNVEVFNLTQSIPAMAPAGDYVFRGFVGFYPNPQLEDHFPFQKLGAGGDFTRYHLDQWASTGAEQFAAALADRSGSTDLPPPIEYALEGVYPNPFNPAATVTLALPEAAELNVAVFNVLGELVASLAHGSYPAGRHTFSLDGSQLASGIYFVKAQVPGKLDTIRKITLMK